MRKIVSLSLLWLAAAALVPPLAAQQNSVPENLREAGFDQRLGATLPLDATFRDEQGRDVRLGDYFGQRPVILALVYYECPMLCTLVLNGMTGSLKTLDFDAGREFEVVAVSFDPGETPELAARRRDEFVRRYGRPGSAAGWHFLTGSEASIHRLTEAAGFRYTYDPATDEYAHAAGLLVATPDGRLARYFYGIEYSPRDLRLGLVEAADGKIGSLTDQALLFCFHYDPATGRYTAAVMNLMRAGGALTVLAIALLVTLMWRRDKHRLAAARNA